MTGNTHEWPIRVYYEDTDAQGIVYYANYLKYLERARTEFLRSKGFEQNVLIEEQCIVFSVKAVQMDYLKPARFNDELIAITKVAELKRVSLIFHQTIVRLKHNREIINKAVITVACLDAHSMKAKVVPQLIIERLT